MYQSLKFPKARKRKLQILNWLAIRNQLNRNKGLLNGEYFYFRGGVTSTQLDSFTTTQKAKIK